MGYPNMGVSCFFCLGVGFGKGWGGGPLKKARPYWFCPWSPIKTIPKRVPTTQPDRSCVDDHAHVINGDACLRDVGCENDLPNTGWWPIEDLPQIVTAGLGHGSEHISRVIPN